MPSIEKKTETNENKFHVMFRAIEKKQNLGLCLDGLYMWERQCGYSRTEV